MWDKMYHFNYSDNRTITRFEVKDESNWQEIRSQ